MNGKTGAPITPKWMTEAALADIAKHPINSGASEAREMAEEILRLRKVEAEYDFHVGACDCVEADAES